MEGGMWGIGRGLMRRIKFFFFHLLIFFLLSTLIVSLSPFVLLRSIPLRFFLLVIFFSFISSYFFMFARQKSFFLSRDLV